ncbi:MAG: hypothetical protein COB60_06035 [Flavobacteriaceae bacterium]|nr:MAG: hypothetical protein COB60_06035 [Flavobacteriaceae bacterium]
MKFVFKVVSHVIIFTLLTIISQIGGLIYFLSLFISKKWNLHFKFKSMFVFLTLYLFSTLIIVPLIAPLFGREKIKNTERIHPTNYMTILLNRNYVHPKLNDLLYNTEIALSKTSIEIHYLDANFPFINNFPLLPHLSHNDGKKLDLSLIYETKDNHITNKQKSLTGYGVFESPKPEETNQINSCLKKGYFQYDFPKYLTFGTINTHLLFSEKGTKKLIESMLTSNSLGKLFIEPHLKQRLHLTDRRVRYHGCKAVRHDDHIHIQLK